MLSTIATELEDNRRADFKPQELFLLLGIACQIIEVRARKPPTRLKNGNPFWVMRRRNYDISREL